MKSKITIDTIKSEAARFQIENYTTEGRMLSKAAISAVVKAEQDAEERAVKTFEEWIAETYDDMPKSLQVRFKDRFIELLNNGGESDE